MAYARGKFGIEYTPVKRNDDSSLAGLVVVVVATLLVISGGIVIYGRLRTARTDADARQETPVPSRPPETARDETPPRAASAPQPLPSDDESAPAVRMADSDVTRRPQHVRNLLLRLDAAEREHDLEMAVSTIEQLRALPGAPTADLDDSLARRLSALNIRRLFELRNAQWVKTVTVRGGDSLARIAHENGATVASTVRLNPGVDPDRIRIGQTLNVLNHPRFNLVIHSRTMTADLQLNGKFFRRYDLADKVKAPPGIRELPAAKVRKFWADLGVAFSAADRSELETLLPAGTSVLVSEL